MKQNPIYILFLLILFMACNNEQKQPEKKLTNQEILMQNIDSLKRIAQKGDLIVRLNDDLISEQVKLLNETDKSYSHAGIIVEQHGLKYVCHIMPEMPGADTVQLTPIDSFINPLKNIRCALYRYDIPANEKDSMQAVLLQYKQSGVHFDRLYNQQTDSVLYCSEMIAKSLSRVTNGMIVPKAIPVPQKLKRLLEKYFAQYKNPKKLVEDARFVTIDNLYLIDKCKQLMQFNLKIFPGN